MSQGGENFMSTRELAPARTTEATTAPAVGVLRRKCACGTHTAGGGECDSCGKERLQRKASHRSETTEVPEVVNEVLRSPGQPLDASTRSFMEPRFGHDFSHVRVHTDARAAESARAVNALAYTVGSHVAVRADRHEPETAAGRRLLAHELAHVVQQSSGGGGVGGDPESRADAAAQRVMAGQEVSPEVVGAAPAGLYRQHDKGEDEAASDDDDEFLRFVRGHFGSSQRRNVVPQPSFPDVMWHPPWTPRFMPREGNYFSMLQTPPPATNLDWVSKLPKPTAGKTGLRAGENPGNPYLERDRYIKKYTEKALMTGKNPTEMDMVIGQVIEGLTKTVTPYVSEWGKKKGRDALKWAKRQRPGRGIDDGYDPGPGMLERLRSRLCGEKKKEAPPIQDERVTP
jgi:Domain of unknown function (DUF4157)